jgi:GH25 family lysozyme M1 (1,4-beta-N-acetylmuramidase)
LGTKYVQKGHKAILSKRRIHTVFTYAAAVACSLFLLAAVRPAWGADVVPDGGGRAQAGAPPGAQAQVQGQVRAAASGPSYAVQGIDVSSHDHSTGPIDWYGVAAGGVQFAYVKATEGTSYVNPYFHDDYNAAKSVGILTGAYVFARPDKRNPVAEANFFIDRAEWVNDSRTLIPFLDLEWPYASLNLPACWGLTQAEMVGYIRAFVDTVRARTGRDMMIYTNTNWWNPCTGNNTSFAANPLDIAGYTSNPPPLPSGWTNYAIWQYAAGNPSIAGRYDRDAFNGEYPALTALAGDVPAMSAPISLMAQVNDRYVSAQNAGRGPLVANATAPGLWEQFDQIDAGGGFIALRSRVNGRYVTADNAGTSPLIANRYAIGGWEQFQIIDNGDGTISLLARVNGRYVTADNAGTSPLIANRTAIGWWERFKKIGRPPVVSLLSHANGRYVTAESGGRLPLIANRSAIGPWEQFERIDAGGGFIALRSRANGRYVTAERAGASPLIANRALVGTWEQFQPVNNPDGTVSLLARANGRYVTADNAGASPLIANRVLSGPWESFTIS